MKSKKAQKLSYRFLLNLGSKHDSPGQINCENFITGLYGRFSSNPWSKTGFFNLGWELESCPLYRCALMWHQVLCARKWEKIRALLLVVYQPFLSHFIGPRLKHILGFHATSTDQVHLRTSWAWKAELWMRKCLWWSYMQLHVQTQRTQTKKLVWQFNSILWDILWATRIDSKWLNAFFFFPQTFAIA